MRLIDADKMCADLATVDPQYKTMIDWCIRVTEAQPTVDAVPVKHGKWIDRNGAIVAPFWERYECSLCGARSDNSKYCPNCGARMDGDRDEPAKRL